MRRSKQQNAWNGTTNLLEVSRCNAGQVEGWNGWETPDRTQQQQAKGLHDGHRGKLSPFSVSLRRSSFASAPLALRKTHTRAPSSEARACTHVFRFNTKSQITITRSAFMDDFGMIFSATNARACTHCFAFITNAQITITGSAFMDDFSMIFSTTNARSSLHALLFALYWDQLRLLKKQNPTFMDDFWMILQYCTTSFLCSKLRLQ